MSKVSDIFRKGLLYDVGRQLVGRLVSFLVQLVVVRLVSQEDLGLADLQLQLFVSILSLLTRVCYRNAMLHSGTTSEEAHVALGSILPLAALGYPLALGLVRLFGGAFLPARMVIVYGGAYMLELLAEPVYVMLRRTHALNVHFWVGTIAVLARGLVLLTCCWVAPGPAAFAAAQFAYSAVSCAGYYFYYGQRVPLIMPAYASPVAQRLRDFWQESVLWAVFDNAERLVLMRVVGLADQGVYAVVSGLSYLIVRTILAPLGDTARDVFAHALKEREGDLPRRSLVPAGGALVVFMRVTILFCSMYTVLAVPYAHDAIRFLYGPTYVQTSGPTLLAASGLLAMVLGLNDLGESFLRVAGQSDLHQMRRSHRIVHGLFYMLVLAPLLVYVLGGAMGVVVASGVGMALRALHAFYTIHHIYYKLYIPSLLPSAETLFVLLLALGVGVQLPLLGIPTALVAFGWCWARSEREFIDLVHAQYLSNGKRSPE